MKTTAIVSITMLIVYLYVRRIMRNPPAPTLPPTHGPYANLPKK